LIRAKATIHGRSAIFLGLTRENVQRLEAGDPILVDGRTVAVPEVDVVIFFGETTGDLIRTLKRETGLQIPEVPHVGIPVEYSPRGRKGGEGEGGDAGS
jgi:hypothetical protein